MISQLDIKSVSDLEVVVHRMTSDVDLMRTHGKPNAQEVRQLAKLLSQTQLTLKDLEWGEACRGIPSRTMAGRFVELWSAIRSARAMLDRMAPRSKA